jgi:macrolide-specific efflux system membrane fusion protein
VVTGGQTSQVKAATSTEGSSESSSSEGSASSTSSSGSPSIVLNSPRLHLFAVSLTQADAVKVKPGDTATLIIDALNQTVKGRLVSITPLPQVKNRVVNFTATVVATGLPQKLRTGMTADVTILTADRKNVPVLSPAALPASTGTVTVEVLRKASLNNGSSNWASPATKRSKSRRASPSATVWGRCHSSRRRGIGGPSARVDRT